MDKENSGNLDELLERLKSTVENTVTIYYKKLFHSLLPAFIASSIAIAS